MCRFTPWQHLGLVRLMGVHAARGVDSIIVVNKEGPVLLTRATQRRADRYNS